MTASSLVSPWILRCACPGHTNRRCAPQPRCRARSVHPPCALAHPPTIEYLRARGHPYARAGFYRFSRPRSPGARRLALPTVATAVRQGQPASLAGCTLRLVCHASPLADHKELVVLPDPQVVKPDDAIGFPTHYIRLIHKVIVGSAHQAVVATTCAGAPFGYSSFMRSSSARSGRTSAEIRLCSASRRSRSALSWSMRRSRGTRRLQSTEGTPGLSVRDVVCGARRLAGGTRFLLLASGFLSVGFAPPCSNTRAAPDDVFPVAKASVAADKPAITATTTPTSNSDNRRGLLARVRLD